MQGGTSLPVLAFVFRHLAFGCWFPFYVFVRGGEFLGAKLGGWIFLGRFVVYRHFDITRTFGRFYYCLFGDGNLPLLTLAGKYNAELVAEVVLEVDEPSIGVHVLCTYLRG